VREPGLVIDGARRPAVAGHEVPATDPGTGEHIARIALADEADVDAAVQSAEDAYRRGSWGGLPIPERAAHLRRLADLIEARQDILSQIESLDEGKPVSDAAFFDVPQVAATLRYYADLSERLPMRHRLEAAGVDAYAHLQPYGVCAFIVPWNAPLLLLGWALGAALAAGNTAVIKPASDASLSLLYLGELCLEAGLPDGVVNVVTGTGATAGMALAGHPGVRRLAFTGSPEAGRQVSEVCGRSLTPVKLELGGKGAAVIFDDVDIASTAHDLAIALTLNAGQVCCMPSRWVIHERVAAAFLDAASVELSSLSIGHGLAEGTQMGPVINERQRARVADYLARGWDQGATVMLDGGPITLAGLEGGSFVSPVILLGAPDNVCAREEIFGPVAFATTFRTENEALDVVNGTAYGLANSVWTADNDRATRVAEAMSAGTSWINCHNVFSHGVPYGGWHQSGMGGGVLSAESYRDYLRLKAVVRVAGA
jgi:aldehyde dehydrogenase (NAD+)